MKCPSLFRYTISILWTNAPPFGNNFANIQVVCVCHLIKKPIPVSFSIQTDNNRTIMFIFRVIVLIPFSSIKLHKLAWNVENVLGTCRSKTVIFSIENSLSMWLTHTVGTKYWVRLSEHRKDKRNIYYTVFIKGFEYYRTAIFVQSKLHQQCR